MLSENPFAEFRKECEKALAKALEKVRPEAKVGALPLNKPPNIEFGQLSSSLCFELAKKLKQKPITVAEQIVQAVDKSSFLR
jgi:arginyl-tRNA synthetase